MLPPEFLDGCYDNSANYTQLLKSGLPDLLKLTASLLPDAEYLEDLIARWDKYLSR